MKKLLYILLIFGSVSCTKRNVETVISRDCTGTYVTVGNYDYKVCNIEITDAFEDGKEVEIDYRKVNKCSDLEGTVRCEMLHKFKAYIKIKTLKQL